jgi:transcriptional regulator with XRE-family HTH domain
MTGDNPAAAIAHLEAFGRRVRQLREALGLPLAEFGAAAGIDAGRLDAVEHGTEETDLDSIFHLAAALRVPPGELFRRDDEHEAAFTAAAVAPAPEDDSAP